jgi:hypothetical protein
LKNTGFFKSFSGKTGFLNQALKWKMSIYAVKIHHNSTVKYATTTTAAWNIKILGFNDTNISNTIENCD